MGVLPRAAPGLAAVWWTLVLVSGILPAAFTLAIGGLVGAAQQGKPLEVPVAAAGLVFLAMNALGPIQEAISSDLGARAGSWLHDRLMRASTTPPGIAHLEDPALADRLSAARTFDLGISAPPLAASLPRIAAGFAEIISGLAQGVLLAGYRWWAPLLIGAAWISTHVLLRDASTWKVFSSDPVVSANRRSRYAYTLAVEAAAAKEVRVFGLAGWVVDLVADSRRRVVETLLREQRLHQGPTILGLAAVLIAYGLVFWSLARDAGAGSLPLAALVIFAQAAIGMSTLAFSEFDWWFRGSAQPIPEVLDLGPRMEAVGALSAGSRAAAGLPERQIRFDAVTFAYADGAPPVLEDLELTIPAGTSLAIVGPNGAGKTTLAKLLCRLYDPQKGAVLADGVDLREVDINSWRAQIAAVFQDFVRYELPLRDNVAPGGATDEQVEQALATAGAEGLAAPGTVLSRAYEGGTDLSGGQWQRVALARALAAVELGAGVVILDEPTAQLDVRGEAEIFDRILEATRGCTTILISHRFSTVRHADRICVLEGGKVVEAGTHDQLMRKRGRYRRMFELQAARFTLDGGEEADGEEL
jgi:ABC-type multidrug transport system fused ATPase/permease subunit